MLPASGATGAMARVATSAIRTIRDRVDSDVIFPGAELACLGANESP